MFGLQIKIASKSKASFIAALQEVIKSIQGGDDNAYIPLNDENKTEVDYFIVEDTLRYGHKAVFDDWHE